MAAAQGELIHSAYVNRNCGRNGCGGTRLRVDIAGKLRARLLEGGELLLKLEDVDAVLYCPMCSHERPVENVRA